VGRRVLLHMMTGSKEDAETVTVFFEDMKRRGLTDPLLVISDGAPVIIKAMEILLSALCPPTLPGASHAQPGSQGGRLRIQHRPPTLPGEALIRAAERSRSVKVSEFERRQLAAVKKE
jgi:hypothetical protein